MISTGLNIKRLFKYDSNSSGCTILNCAIYYLQRVLFLFFFLFFPLVDDVQNVQIVCVWCQKEGVKRYSLCMGSELKSFCSEKCFAACRRAYFKRNKVSGKRYMNNIHHLAVCHFADCLSSVYCAHFCIVLQKVSTHDITAHTTDQQHKVVSGR